MISIRTPTAVVYGLAMATKDSREVVIDATPEQILDVIADVESTPDWSPQYQKAEVLDRFDDPIVIKGFSWMPSFGSCLLYTSPSPRD